MDSINVKAITELLKPLLKGYATEFAYRSFQLNPLLGWESQLRWVCVEMESKLTSAIIDNKFPTRVSVISLLFIQIIWV